MTPISLKLLGSGAVSRFPCVTSGHTALWEKGNLHGLTLLLSTLVPLFFATKILCLTSKCFILEAKIPLRPFLPQDVAQEILAGRQARRKLEKDPEHTPCPTLGHGHLSSCLSRDSQAQAGFAIHRRNARTRPSFLWEFSVPGNKQSDAGFQP